MIFENLGVRDLSNINLYQSLFIIARCPVIYHQLYYIPAWKSYKKIHINTNLFARCSNNRDDAYNIKVFRNGQVHGADCWPYIFQRRYGDLTV